MLPAALALALVAVVPLSVPEVTPVSTASHDVVPATEVLTLEGTRIPFVQSTPVQMALRGEMCKGEFVCRAVNYPASLSPSSAPKGVQALNADLQQATEPVVVFGFSQGASVATELMIARAEGRMPEAVVPESYVLIGNPQHGLNGIFKINNFENPYPTTNISVEYDLFSDFPNNPFNILAIANAFSGLALAHRLGYGDVDVNSYDNLIYQDGQTTYILVPTENLPILQGWRNIGLGFIADALEGPFRASINRAYDRSMYEVQASPVEVQVEEAPQQDAPSARATIAMDEPNESSEDDFVEQQVQSVISTPEKEDSVEQSEGLEPVYGYDQDDVVETEIPEPDVQQEETEGQSSTDAITDDEEESVLDNEDVAEDIDIDVDIKADDEDDNEEPKQRFGESSSESDSQASDSGDDNSSSNSDSDSDSDSSSSSNSGSEE